MLDLNRRELVRILFSGTAGLTLTAGLSAQRGPGRNQTPAPVTVSKLSDRIAVFGGTGGNVGVIIGPDGLMMIDGGTANRADDLLAAIAGVSPRMIQVLFNTHYHFDHVGSNEVLGARHVRIVAHENVKKRLATTFDDPAMGRKMDALSPAGLPTETFTDGGKIDFGGEHIEYTHTPMAHTDGDAFLLLRSSNILHTGDLLWIGRYPVVDYTVGGSLGRMAESIAQMDGLIDNDTKIIPGHGPASVTRSDMRQTREMWIEIDRRLGEQAKQGHSIEEVLAAAPTKDFDEKLGVRNPEAFLRQAYGGVLAKR